MDVKTLGIDLGKNVFHVVGLDDRGAIALKRRVTRAQLAVLAGNLPRCLIGMEACPGSHHMARRLEAHGHTVRLLPPQYVRPYVKTNKNDFRDAEAIAEAVGRGTMRFVTPKTVAQLDLQALHRVRARWVGHRTALMNQIRAFLLEQGRPMRPGRGALRGELRRLLAADAPVISPSLARYADVGIMRTSFGARISCLRRRSAGRRASPRGAPAAAPHAGAPRSAGAGATGCASRSAAWRPTPIACSPGGSPIPQTGASCSTCERPALFTCVARPDVEATNWQAEQTIRPAVVTRKVCGGNRTPRGAATQSIVASVLLPALRISAAPRMAAYALGARASQAQEPVRPRLAETIGKQELA